MLQAEKLFNQAFLQAHGIQCTPETFLRTLRQAVESLPRVGIRDPRSELAAQELEVLRQGGFELEPADFGDNNPLARTATDLAVLAESSMTVTEVAKRLGVDRSRILQRLKAERSLYGFWWENRWLIPGFQFEGRRCLPHLREVVRALPKDIHPLAVYYWCTNPDLDLEDEDSGRALSPRE